jgi:hypothetical protein
MKMNGKFYYKIDVHSRSDGYSFMVRSDDELSDNEAISRALSADCFNDEEDADAATVDTLIDEEDVAFFTDSTYDV